MSDRRRAARAAVLGAWAVFFVYLLASGEMVRYIGPRTQWVVFFGAGGLVLATIGYVVAPRGASTLTIAEARALAPLLLPIAAVLLVPTPQLGALAASRRAPGDVVGAAGAFAPTAAEAGGRVSFLEIDYASRSSEYATTAGIVEGRTVHLLGFVSAAGSGEVRLTRFYIACCAADAIPYSVTVRAPAAYRVDQWLEVSGTLARGSSGFVVDARHVRPTSPPDDPYLS